MRCNRRHTIPRLVLDLDDTGYSTIDEMVKRVRATGTDCPTGVYLTPQNAGPEFASIINCAEFMRTAPIKEGFLSAVRDLSTRSVPLAVCTHRGYHAKGAHNTTEAMQRDGLSTYIRQEHVHVIDPATDSNKIEYLESVYGNNFVLVDDRPGFDAVLNDPRIILFSQPWNEGKSGHRIPDWSASSIAYVMERLREVGSR